MKPVKKPSAWVVAVLVCSLVVGPLAVSSVDGKQASFADATVSDHRGDIIEVTVHASQKATVNLGSPEDGFWAPITVPKGTTTLAINTYKADSRTEAVTRVEGGLVGDTNATIPSQSGPLQPGTYDMNITVEIDDKNVTQDMGSFTVKERETGDAKTLVLPASASPSTFESSADLLKAASETDNGTIAKGDQFVLALNASGLGGFIEQANLSGGDEHVSVHFHESNYERNTQPNEIDGEDVREDEPNRLLLDEENNKFYLVLDTGEHGIEAGDEYEVTFEIGEENPMVAKSETATTMFTVVERQVTLDYSGDVIVVENETAIGGTTTLAPGSTINVTAFDEGKNPFFWPKKAAVTKNRTFSTSFDFSSVESGTEFTVELRDQDISVKGIVASAPPKTPTPTITTTTTTTTTTTISTTTTTTTTNATATATTAQTPTATPVPTEQPITAQTVSEGGLPGFDVSVALVALVAAVLLVVRRSE
ncbi:BGTF surface domain-containing protein [Haladaptatus sp. NG-SE-30]